MQFFNKFLNFRNSEDFSIDLNSNFMDGRRFEQVAASMDHLTRVFVDRSDVFHRANVDRIRPSGFDGLTLFDVLTWLFQESGSSQFHYRRKCMEMFLKIYPECGTKDEIYQDHLGLDKVLSIGEVNSIAKCKDLSRLSDSQDPIFKEIYKWLQMLLTTLDFYIWIFEEDIIPKQEMQDFFKQSVVMHSISYFLSNVVNKDILDVIRTINEDLFTRSQISFETKMCNRNLDNIDTIRCFILVRVIDFLTLILKEEVDLSFWTENEAALLKISKILIFKPQQLRFDFKSKNSLLQLPSRLTSFVSAIHANGPIELKNHLIDLLQRKLIKHFNAICQNCESFIEQSSVNVQSINKLNGVDLIVSKMMQQLELDDFADQLLFKTAEVLLNKLFDRITDNKAEILRPRNLSPTTKAFASSIMRLCFKINASLPKIILFSFNDTQLKISDACTVLQGEHFMQTFKNPIFELFTSMLTETIQTLVTEMKDTTDGNRLRLMTILTDLNEFIFKHHQENSKVLEENAAAEVAHWPTIMQVAMSMENKQNCVDLALINLVTRMAMTSPIELFDLGQKLEKLQTWIFNLLENRENSLEIKSKAVMLLPCITSSNDKINDKLMKALSSIQQKHMPLRSNEFPDGSLERAGLVSITTALFKSLSRSRSPVLYRFIINATIADDKYIMESKLQHVQIEMMEHSSVPEQEVIVEQTFDAFLSGGFEPEIRLNFVSRFLLTVLKNSQVEVILNFMLQKMSVIWNLTEASLNIDTENALVNRCGGYMIIEAFVASVPRDRIEKESFNYAGRLNNGTNMIKDIIKKAKEVRSDVVFMVDDPVKQEYFRKFQCYCFRALAATVSNTKDKPELYNLTLFKENPQSNLFIWRKLVDVRNDDLYSKWTQEFDEMPRLKEFMISVKDLKTNDDSSSSKKYIETVSIFDRSLSQSLTKSDLSYSVVYSNRELLEREQQRREAEHQKTMKIQLESTPINDHEVMSVLVGVVNHIYQNKISPYLSLEKYEDKKYEWVLSLAASMGNQDNHKNVRIFLAKLVDNCRSVFVHYAKQLLGAVLSVITDGCLGNEMNFFITDLVTMLLSWSHIYKPDELSEKQDACALLKFLMEKAHNDRDDIFKLNLELIKRLVETWSEVLSEKIPTQTLLDLLQKSIEQESNQKIKCGIQLNAVILANDLLPWSNVEQRDTFIRAIVGCFNNSSAGIYQAAAQLLGMFLNKIVGDQTIIEGDANYQLVDQITQRLNRIREKADINVFLQILYGIQKGFPRILDTFMTLIKFNIKKSVRKIKCTYLEMFLSRLEIEGAGAYREMVSFDIKDLLKQTEYQLLALHIINKALDQIEANHVTELVDELIVLVRSPNYEVRRILYEIMIFIVQKYQNDDTFEKKKAMQVLLKGFTDSDPQIFNRVTNFFSVEDQLAKTFAGRFQELLEKYYDPDLEKEFLHYATKLLLDIPIRHPRSCQPLLDYDHTRNHEFFEYPISTKSNTQRSLPPLFIQSQQTQLLAGDGSMYDKMIRATQLNSGNQMFTPTQDPIKMSQVSQTFSFKQTQDSLFVSLKPQFLDRRSKTCSLVNEDIDLDDVIARNKEAAKPDAFDYLRQRITKQDSEKKSKEFALKAIDRRNFHEAKQEERVRKSREGREVKLYRRYRLGDYPDFFFNGLAILLPLQALAQKNESVARVVFISIFESIIDILSASKDESEKLFYVSINQSITKILQQTKNSDSFLLGTLVEMAMKSGKYMEISPDVLANVSSSSNMIVTGVLFLESQLVHLLNEPEELDGEPNAKRQCVAEDTTKLKHWLKLIELNYKMSEYEVISGIFTEKLNLVPETRKSLISAIDSESRGHFVDASQVYEQLIRNSEARNQNEKEFYYQSFFNCLANLSDWREIAKEIRAQFNSYNDVWDEQMPFHRETFLPHLLKSELRMILNEDIDDEFTVILEDWINDDQKSSMLREMFPEEVTMLHILESKFAEGSVEAEHALRNLSDEWSCLEMLDEKMKCLKNARTLAELTNFITIMSSPSPEKKLEKLYQNWKLSVPKSSDSLIQWGDLISYRRNFHKLVDNEETPRDATCLLDIQRNLINVAFAQNNCDAAKFLINGLKDEIRGEKSVEKIIKCNLAIGKYNFIVAEQRLTSPDEQMIKLCSGLSKLTDGVFKRPGSKNFSKVLIETHCCASEISWKLWTIYENCRATAQVVPEEYQLRILQLIDGNLDVSESLLRFAESSLKEAKKLAQVHLNNNYGTDAELILADTFLKLGKFYHQVYGSGTLTVSRTNWFI